MILISIKIIYKYFTFEKIKKDQIVNFVYLLNEKLLEMLENKELELFNDDIKKYGSEKEYDTEIEDDYENIKNHKHIENVSENEWETDQE